MTKILQYFQEKVVFLPISLQETYQFQFLQNFEEYFFETDFGGRINALHFKIENPKGVILYFHGNADNLHRWGKIAGSFTKFGYDVLVYDYRGYGKSTGARTEEYLFTDAQFCYNFLKKNYSEEQIILYGRSLGGAFATKIASENFPKMVILECTFFNLQDMANRWIPSFLTNQLSAKVTYHFLSNVHIQKVQVPLYHFHGTRDLVVPIKSGKKLFAQFEKHQPKIPKNFIEIKGGSHDDLVKYEKFQQELAKILK